MAVRVRFAPSPTGPLHLGSAMTAVANHLFARRAGGVMVLRIDDTDAERSERRFERVILQDAEWLGLRFDEGPEIGGTHGPYHQSERGASHTMAGDLLRERTRAYPCFCDEERLEQARRSAEAAGRPWRYDGGCDALAPGEGERRQAAGETAALRFRAPATDVVIEDAARGKVRVPAGTVGDFVLLRSTGTATYNFATAIDDAAMQITHVIRGEDHMSNTARQLMILDALEWRAPRYGHCALLLDADGHKLTKSRGAESIADFRNGGYPPEALMNYAALLVCPPPEGGEEVASPDDLAARFELSRLSSGVARFDRARLDWLSQEHLKRLNPLDLASRVGRVLELRGIGAHPAQLTALAEGLRGAHTLTEAADEAEQVIRRRRSAAPPGSRAALALFSELRKDWPEAYLSPSEAGELLAELRQRGEQQGVTPRQLLPALRRGLTGADHGIALPYVIAAIERSDALSRAGASDE